MKCSALLLTMLMGGLLSAAESPAPSPVPANKDSTVLAWLEQNEREYPTTWCEAEQKDNALFEGAKTEGALQMLKERSSCVVSLKGSKADKADWLDWKIFGLRQYLTSDKSYASLYDCDVWLKLTAGSPNTVIAGSGLSPNKGDYSNTLLTPKGTRYTEIGAGASPFMVVGAHATMTKDFQSVPDNTVLFKGNTLVVVDGPVRNAVYGGCLSRYSKQQLQTEGNSGVFIRCVLGDSENPGNDSGHILGGSGCCGPSTGISQTGNSFVSVRLPDNASGTFGRQIHGGSHGWGRCWDIDGDTSVSISAPNTVTFSKPIYGGSYNAGGQSAKVTGSTSLTIAGGTYTGSLYGGSGSVKPKAPAEIAGSASTVIRSGVFNGEIYGGSNGAGCTVGSSGLTLTGGTFSKPLYGGSNGGTVTGNTALTVDGGTCKGTLYGGSKGGTVTGNTTVTLKGGTVSAAVYGGSKGGTVKGNTTVTLKGGTYSNISIFAGGSDRGAVEGCATIVLDGCTLGRGVGLWGIPLNGSELKKGNYLKVNADADLSNCKYDAFDMIETAADLNLTLGEGMRNGNKTRRTSGSPLTTNGPLTLEITLSEDDIAKGETVLFRSWTPADTVKAVPTVNVSNVPKGETWTVVAAEKQALTVKRNLTIAWPSDKNEADWDTGLSGFKNGADVSFGKTTATAASPTSVGFTKNVSAGKLDVSGFYRFAKGANASGLSVPPVLTATAVTVAKEAGLEVGGPGEALKTQLCRYLKLEMKDHPQGNYGVRTGLCEFVLLKGGQRQPWPGSLKVTASGSSEKDLDNNPYKLTDGDPDPTKCWLTRSDEKDASGASVPVVGTLIFDAGEGRTFDFDAYRLHFPDAAAQRPKNWTLSRSDDCRSWEPVSSYSLEDSEALALPSVLTVPQRAVVLKAPVTVSSGAVLSGSGTITGNVTLESGAKLAVLSDGGSLTIDKVRSQGDIPVVIPAKLQAADEVTLLTTKQRGLKFAPEGVKGSVIYRYGAYVFCKEGTLGDRLVKAALKAYPTAVSVEFVPDSGLSAAGPALERAAAAQELFDGIVGFSQAADSSVKVTVGYHFGIARMTAGAGADRKATLTVRAEAVGTAVGTPVKLTPGTKIRLLCDGKPVEDVTEADRLDENGEAVFKVPLAVGRCPRYSVEAFKTK